VRSISYCNFFSLSDVHFNKILESYPVMRRTLETIAARRLQSLGENPTILTSRESLLEDIQGIYTIITDAAEAHEEALAATPPGRGGGGGADGNVERQQSKTAKSQFLDAVKGFFTKDSDVLLRASSKTLANFELLTGEERPAATAASDRSGRGPGGGSGTATPKRSASACDGEPIEGAQWPAGMFLAPPGEPPKRSMSSSDVNIFALGGSGGSGGKVQQRAPGATHCSNRDDRPKSSGGK